MEAVAPSQPDSRAVTVIAGVVSVLFALLHVGFALAVPQYQDLYSELGEDLPLLTGTLMSLRAAGLTLVLLVIDVLLFSIAYWLSRRYWLGLVFVAPLLYLGLTSLLVITLYLPMQNIIQLVR